MGSIRITHALKRAMRIFIAGLVFLALSQSGAMAADVTGTWEYRGPRTSGMWLKTLQKGQVVRFQLELQRGAPSYNSGWIEGEFELQGDTGVFRQSDNDALCEIAFHFQARRVELKSQDLNAGCGFGFNVYADGVLNRQNAKPPRFTQGDPREGR